MVTYGIRSLVFDVEIELKVDWTGVGMMHTYKRARESQIMEILTRYAKSSDRIRVQLVV